MLISRRIAPPLWRRQGDNVLICRTWLFAPGIERRKLEKALLSRAHVVIVDWEDAVAEGKKEDARVVTREVLTTTRRPAGRIAIRVNGVESAHHQPDLEALHDLPFDIVMLPKAEDPQPLSDLGEGHPSVVPLVESALGVERMWELANAHPRVERLAFGSVDFGLDVGAQGQPHEEPFRYVRSKMVILSRAARLEGPVDGVNLATSDTDAVRRQAEAARAMGFGGMLAIHPRQLDLIEQAFLPTPEEIGRAKRILQAAAEAARDGRGVTQLDGALIDRPVILWAEAILSQAGQRFAASTVETGEAPE